MTHTQTLTVPVSLCCITFSGYSTPTYPLPKAIEPQLLHALKRMDQVVRKIKIKSCNKNKPDPAMHQAKGAIT